MDYRERFAELEEALRMALRAERASVWTTLPGIIVSFDPDEVTAVVRPALQGVIQAADGTASAVDLPLLIHCPVVFPRGGGVTLTFPIAPGDECLLSFSARCIDGWWQAGGVQLPMEPRMHDLSDGFCTVGPMSQVRKIAGISTTTAQLRTDDGAAFVDLDPATHAIRATTTGDVHVTAGGALSADITGAATVHASSASVTAPTIALIGAVSVTGTLSVSGLASLNGGFASLPQAGGGASVINSPVQVTGQTTLAGVTAGGKDIGPAHTHTNGNGGGPTGGVI